MKRLFLIFLFYMSLFHPIILGEIDYIQLAQKYLIELKKLSLQANLMFSEALALQLGKQFSYDEHNLNDSLLVESSNLRQQIELMNKNFAKEFKL